jgi:cell division protease FtsH
MVGRRAEPMSEGTQRRIDEAVRAIVAAAFDRATHVLSAHRAALDRCAKALLERETLEAEAILSLAPQLRAVAKAA